MDKEFLVSAGIGVLIAGLIILGAWWVLSGPPLEPVDDDLQHQDNIHQFTDVVYDASFTGDDDLTTADINTSLNISVTTEYGFEKHLTYVPGEGFLATYYVFDADATPGDSWTEGEEYVTMGSEGVESYSITWMGNDTFDHGEPPCTTDTTEYDGELHDANHELTVPVNSYLWFLVLTDNEPLVTDQGDGTYEIVTGWYEDDTRDYGYEGTGVFDVDENGVIVNGTFDFTIHWEDNGGFDSEAFTVEIESGPAPDEIQEPGWVDEVPDECIDDRR